MRLTKSGESGKDRKGLVTQKDTEERTAPAGPARKF